MAVALLFKGDDLALGRQRREELGEGGLDGVATAMQQYQRWLVSLVLAVDLVIEVQAVYGGVTRLWGGHDRVLGLEGCIWSNGWKGNRQIQRRAIPRSTACEQSTHPSGYLRKPDYASACVQYLRNR
ncbi:hypothetical protein D9M71_769580 [compost metagenome]